MKIFINTLTPTEIYNIRQSQIDAKMEEKDLFNGTPTINGELFIPGEWKHVVDDFFIIKTPKLDEKGNPIVDEMTGEPVVELTDISDDYPYLKEAHLYIEEETQKALQERGLIAMAQGLEDAAAEQEKDVPEIAITIKAVPIKEIVAVDTAAVAISDAGKKGIPIDIKPIVVEEELEP